MKFFDIKQNSDDWYLARAGIPTASQFSRIVTPTGKISTSHVDYAYECVAEIYMGKPIDSNFTSRAMEWGNYHEAEAINSYELLTGFNLKHGGFFTDDNMNYGASPDVRIYDGDKLVGVAEIKCPQVATHIHYVLMEGKINPKYIPQVQGHLLVTGAEWCDWFSYHPDLPYALVRTYRDDTYIAKLKQQLDIFQETVEIGLQILRNKGFKIEKPIKSFDLVKNKKPKDKSIGLELQKPLY